MTYDENKRLVLGFFKESPGLHTPTEVGREVAGLTKGAAMWGSNILKKMTKEGLVIPCVGGRYKIK